MPMPNKVVSFVAGALATMMLSSASSVLAQKPAGLPGNYPNKLVKVIVGGAPGGGGDIMGRLVAKNMADAWGHTFIVENKVSVLGSAFALEDLSKQPADGYAMMLVAGSTYIGATAVHMVPKHPLNAIMPKTIITMDITPRLKHALLKSLKRREFLSAATPMVIASAREKLNC